MQHYHMPRSALHEQVVLVELARQVVLRIGPAHGMLAGATEHGPSIPQGTSGVYYPEVPWMQTKHNTTRPPPIVLLICICIDQPPPRTSAASGRKEVNFNEVSSPPPPSAAASVTTWLKPHMPSSLRSPCLAPADMAGWLSLLPLVLGGGGGTSTSCTSSNCEAASKLLLGELAASSSSCCSSAAAWSSVGSSQAPANVVVCVHQPKPYQADSTVDIRWTRCLTVF